MTIICLSKDEILADKFRALYGPQHVTVRQNFHLLTGEVMKNCEVIIVDLKDCVVPVDKNLKSPMIVLTGVPTFQEAAPLLHLGVKGYGNRQMRRSNLGQVIESVKAGQIWLPPAIISQLIASVGSETTPTTQANDTILNKLSRREQEVALYVTEGMSNQEMADKMYVSLRTVKAHLSSIYEKTGLRNRLELGLNLKKP